MSSSPRIPHDKLLDMLLDVVCVVDKQGRFLSVSAASERVFGYRPEEMVGLSAFDFIHPDDRDSTRELVESINSGNPNPDHENRYIHKLGHVVHIMWSAQWLDAEQVRVGVARDITERKRAASMQAALYAISEAAHSAQNLETLCAQVHEIIGHLLAAETFCVVSYDGATNQLSFPYFADPHNAQPSAPRPAFVALSAAVMNSRDALLLTPESDDQIYAQIGLDERELRQNWLSVPLLSGSNAIGALVLRNATRPLSYTQRDMELLQFVSNHLTTVIERMATHARLEALAHHDHLTEVPNRALFLKRLDMCVLKASAETSRLAVLYLDLDHFKLVNDTFGHSFGDDLLREVATRLRECVRESDTVGRLGGDEFAVLLPNIGKQADASKMAEKIVRVLSEPYLLNGHILLSGPSVGIAIFPEHGEDGAQLIRRADEAMYKAKAAGGRRYKVAPDQESL